METQKRRPWRRWVVLALMIVGFVVGGMTYFAPVQPEITFAAERLVEEPLFTLPVIGPFYLVNTIPPLIFTVLLVLVLAFYTNRSMKKSAQTDLVPRGIGNLMEAFFELLYNMTEGATGAKWAPVIFPWFATIMFYVLFANLLKLIPGFESIGILRQVAQGHPVTGGILQPGEVPNGYVLVPFLRGVSIDLNFTLAIALISVFMTQVIGIQTQGFGYFSKFFNVRNMFKVPFFGAMDFLVGLLEIISEISKIISFAFRLFGNMFAGLVLVAIVSSLLGKISILPSMIMLFELFVGVIQAFVFGMLTMVFMAQATQGHGHEEEHEETHVEPAEAHAL
ncbi:MAG: F0F1 ATP synthase subunit A [Chloroflexi bacterium]|nr:F0F1 ATP synthase subunit A [Chloroflexota bacterium]